MSFNDFFFLLKYLLKFWRFWHDKALHFHVSMATLINNITKMTFLGNFSSKNIPNELKILVVYDTIHKFLILGIGNLTYCII